MAVTRRGLLTGAAALVGSSSMGAEFWRRVAFAFDAAVPGVGPYGPLGPADQNGVQLPVGFTSRVVARSDAAVGGTAHVWHRAPDGGACFPRSGGGGWIYVSNAELENRGGGVSAIVFDSDGTIADAYTILSGTNRNCAGGATPWGTWLSCEEAGSGGRVFECDPFTPGQGVERPALGRFNHEAAAVDPATGDLYLTEDSPTGRLYRFVPTTPGDLSTGDLFAAAVAGTSVTWIPTSAAGPDRQTATTAFDGGEGIHVGSGVIYIATKGDRRVWELDPAASTIDVVYDCLANPTGALDAVDNVTVHAPTQRVFVAEDGGNMELGVLASDGVTRQVSAFCRFVGHGGSEVTGPAFSPDGTRLYLSSQRGTDGTTGVTVEITGPFDQPFDGAPAPLRVAVTGDTHVRGGSAASTNFGAERLLHVCFNGSEQYTRWAYLRADVSGLTGGVTGATLRISARMSSGGPSPMEVLAVGPNWSADTLTWNGRPDPVPVPLATFTISSTSNEWYDIDVTGHVAAQRASGAPSVAFVIRQTERNGRLAYIASIEHGADAPFLDVLVGEPPPPPPPPTTAPPATTPPVIEPLALATVGATYVRGGANATTNYASAYLLNVCNNGSPTYTRWTYVRVDNAPLAGRSVAAAVLRLTARVSSGAPTTMNVSGTDDRWDASTVSWETRRMPSGPSVEFSITTDDTVHEIDVTAIVAASLAHGESTTSFVIRQSEPNGRLAYVVPPRRSGGPEVVATPVA